MEGCDDNEKPQLPNLGMKTKVYPTSVELQQSLPHTLEFRLDGTKISGENEASC